MKKYITKPLVINCTKGIEALIDEFDVKPKFVVCSGKDSVGKTAMCYKILHGLIKLQQQNCEPLLIWLDTTKKYNYWNKKFIETKVLDEHDFITQVFPLNFPNPFQKIIDTINRYQPNLIIVDGCTTNIKLDTDKNDESVEFLSTLFSYLHKLHTSKSISVIITIKKEDRFVENYFKKLPVELWKLNRPAYLNKDCPERGDTQLFVQNNSV